MISNPIKSSHHLQGPAIELRQLGVSGSGQQLLKPCSQTFAGGQWHGIIGPNGGGKSTLLKAMAGLQAHSGELLYHWPASKGRIGYMPQLNSFEASLPITSLDFLRLNLHCPDLGRAAKNRALHRVIDQLEMPQLMRKTIGRLSTGERQRLLLASALLGQPRLLLVDEPLAGVDSQGRQLMLAIFDHFCHQGGTLIMIEHDQEVLQRYGHQLWQVWAAELSALTQPSLIPELDHAC